MPTKNGSSSNPLRSTILKVFSTKYALTLPTQSLLFIEKVLSEFEGGREEWVTGLELWAREYLRGEDGRGLVDLEALKRAYESLQVKVRSSGKRLKNALTNAWISCIADKHAR